MTRPATTIQSADPSAETIDPDTVSAPADGAGPVDADALAEAGPADPTDPSTITPPEVEADDIEP
jgi:hypothetical protein